MAIVSEGALTLLVAVAALMGCSEKGACVLPTRTRTGGASEVCFYQTEKICLATPPAVSGEKAPLWVRRKTCPAAGFTCVGTGFGTGNRRIQVDGTCPPGSEGPL